MEINANKYMLVDRNLQKRIEHINKIIDKKIEVIKVDISKTTIKSKRPNKTYENNKFDVNKALGSIHSSGANEIDNILKLIINKSLSISNTLLCTLLNVEYNFSMWSLIRQILEYALFFELLTIKKWSENKLQSLAFRTTVYKAGSGEQNPGGLFKIFEDRINITDEFIKFADGMGTFYATLSSMTHPGFRINDLAKPIKDDALTLMMSLYDCTLLLDATITKLMKKYKLKKSAPLG